MAGIALIPMPAVTAGTRLKIETASPEYEPYRYSGSTSTVTSGGIQPVYIRRICSLPGDYEVYPGHMDSTTLERERMFNYYCRSAMQG